MLRSKAHKEMRGAFGAYDDRNVPMTRSESVSTRCDETTLGSTALADDDGGLLYEATRRRLLCTTPSLCRDRLFFFYGPTPIHE